jgi:arylsulfatase A-like enzyme
VTARAHRFLAWTAAVALSAAAVAPGCSGRPEPRRGVILLVIDTLRADRVGAYGYARDTTPGLDAMAARGVLFESVQSAAPWTIPSAATLLTGLYPRSHGVLTVGHPLPADVGTLASLLRDDGYATGAVVNLTMLRTVHGFSRGFDTFRVISQDQAAEGAARRVNELALDWMERNARERFFLFVHHYDVHSNYTARPRYRRMFVEPYEGVANGTTKQLKRHRRGEIRLDADDARHLGDLYDAGLRQLDDDLAQFFEALRARNLLEGVTVIVTSDHGEEFFEHGDFLHGRTLHRELVHVPLLFFGHGIPEGVRVVQPVSHVDVMPTIAALLGTPVPYPVDGVDLSAHWGKDPPRRPRALFSEADNWHHRQGDNFRRAVRVDRFTLHLDANSGRYSLYDLERDPGEQTDLVESEAEVAAELRAQLDTFVAGGRDARAPVELSPEVIEELRSLGYLD